MSFSQSAPGEWWLDEWARRVAAVPLPWDQPGHGLRQSTLFSGMNQRQPTKASCRWLPRSCNRLCALSRFFLLAQFPDLDHILPGAHIRRLHPQLRDNRRDLRPVLG